VLRRLTATPALEQAAAWSPDGTRILFTRYSLDAPWLADVFVVNADGTHERRLTHAAGDDVAALRINLTMAKQYVPSSACMEAASCGT
jgi:Tol biopolymer transport system component